MKISLKSEVAENCSWLKTPAVTIFPDNYGFCMLEFSKHYMYSVAGLELEVELENVLVAQIMTNFVS